MMRQWPDVIQLVLQAIEGDTDCIQPLKALLYDPIEPLDDCRALAYLYGTVAQQHELLDDVFDLSRFSHYALSAMFSMAASFNDSRLIEVATKVFTQENPWQLKLRAAHYIYTVDQDLVSFDKRLAELTETVSTAAVSLTTEPVPDEIYASMEAVFEELVFLHQLASYRRKPHEALERRLGYLLRKLNE